MPLPSGAQAVGATPPPGGPSSLPAGAIPADGGDLSDAGVFADRIVRMLAQGATLGFADEFAAFMRSHTEGIPYDQALAEERGKDTEFRNTNPGTALTANIVGAVASPAAKILGPAKGAGLLVNSIRGGAQGTVLGGVTGFGEGEGGFENRIREGGKGAVVGGITGTAAPPLIHVAGVGLQKLWRVVTGRIGPEAEAARKVLKALQDDRIDAAEAVRKLRELGPEAGLADIGEENVRGVARAATSVPGPARTTGKEFLTERQLGQGGRIAEKVKQSFGAFGRFAETADDLIEARAAAAGPKYNEAYKVEVPFTDELADILQTDAAKRAMATARRIASNEGRTLPQIITDEGTARIALQDVPDMRTWDIVKQGFDSVLNRFRDPVTRKLDLSDPLIHSINDVRKRLIAELDNLNPAYKEARAVFAGPAAALDAMRAGRAFLKGDADITAKIIKDMTPAERDFFRLGVVRGIQDVVENTRDISDVTGRLFGSQAMRDKMRAVFPDDASFGQFEKFMKAEAVMAETRRVVLGGSPTARIHAEQSELMRAGGAAAEFLSGNTVGAVRQALASMKPDLPPEVSERLGSLLFTKGGKLNEDAINKLFRFEKIEGIPSDAQRALVARLSAGAEVGAAEAVQQEQKP